MTSRSGYTLSLSEDRFAPDASRLTLPPCHRVLYALAGQVIVEADGTQRRLAENGAAFATSACVISPGADGATVLRYELQRAGMPVAALSAKGVTSRVLLAQPLELDPREQYLMRCDRVDFTPGAEARPHGHRGGGIRCLIAGALEVRVGAQPGRVMRPGDAWFESGREPVHAIADGERPTAFVRVSILPRAIRGQSSIWYVDPEDARRSTPRSYTVFVDEPIELP